MNETVHGILKPTRVFATLLAFAASSSGAWAQELPEGITVADVDAFRAAIISAGCEIRNEAQAAIVEAATGFDEDKLAALADYLIDSGELLVTDNLAGLGMTGDACSEEDDNEDDNDD